MRRENLPRWLRQIAQPFAPSPELAVALINQIRRGTRQADSTEGERNFLAFALIALSPTGLRAATMQRIFDRLEWWTDSSWTVRRLDAHAALKALVSALPGLLSEGADEVMQAIHGSARDTEYVTLLPSSSSDDGRIIEFSDEDFRLLVLDAFGNDDGIPHARAIKRELTLALSEEALQQHAVLLRHSASRRAVSVRYYRRIIESLWHGVSAAAETSTDEGPFRAFTSFAKEPEAKVLELYTIYRQNVEHANDWWMTRMFGADRAKAQLLRKVTSLPLIQSAPPGNVLMLVRNDAMKSYFHVPHVVRATDRQLLEDLVKIGDTSCAKLLIDSHIHNLELSKAVELCMSQLRLIGSKHLNCDQIDQFLITDDGIERIAIAELENLASEKAQAIQRLTFRENSRPNRQIVSDLVHLLERLGVCYAHQADVPNLQSHERGPLFKNAYAVFRQARLLAIAASTVERVKFSGSSTREFVRACLKLADLPEATLEDRNHLEARARISSNRLALRMSRYPSERAALLILEATFARLSSRADLAAATRLLDEAETILPTEANRPRLRFRFCLERAKVARKLSTAKTTNRAQRLKLIEIAKYDLAELNRMARLPDAPGLFRMLASRQSDALARSDPTSEP